MTPRSRIATGTLIVCHLVWSLGGYGSALGEPAVADSGARRPLTKQDRLTQLKTRQAELDLNHAKVERDRAHANYGEVKNLFDRKLVTIDELKKAEHTLEEAKLAHTQAVIKLERTRLELLQDATLITVINATKSRSQTGRFKVTVTLMNESNLNEARTAMEGVAALTEKELAGLLDINNVIVRLEGKVTTLSRNGEMGRSAEGIVGSPFQQKIGVLRLGEQVELTYELLKKDVEAVNIGVEYLGTKHDYSVFLKKEASQDLPTIVSTQFSQQGRLGSKIRYDVELEYLGEEDRSFSLVVLNLPLEIQAAFMDPESDARLTQVSFSGERSKQSLDLELSIPEKLAQEWVDKRISFDIFVTRPQELKEISAIRAQYADQETIPAEAIARIKGNHVELVLTPKGVGKLDIVVTNLFKEVKQADPVSFKFSILNSGTLALTQVTPELDLPLEWEGRLDPQSISVIDPGQKTVFAAAIDPPLDVAIGEYTLKISAEGSSGVQTVEGVDKNFTVRVIASRNITGTLALVFVLILIVVILAVATVRISRR